MAIADPAALAIAMIAVLALGGRAVWLIVNRRERGRSVLMLVAALVLLGNVLIWTL